MSQPESSKDNLKQSSYERDQVMEIINSVIDKVHATDNASQTAIFSEISELKNIIQNVRNEIGRTIPTDIKDKHIPSATDELDAVSMATEEATQTIMDACEAIQEHTGNIESEASEKINAEIMKIFEACSFQDITGQRISKVTGTLKEIEGKVAAILKHIGYESDATVTEQEDSATSDDEKLLNGPQLPGNSVTQDEIDKLLAEFD